MPRRLGRALLWFVLIPFIIVLFTVVALYIPCVQDAVVRYTTEQLTERLGMRVHIGKLRLRFPAELSIYDLAILPQPTDTLLRVRHLELGLGLRPLLSRTLALQHVRFEGVHFAQQDSLGQTSIRAALSLGVLEAVHIDPTEQQISLGLFQTEGGHIVYSSIDTAASPRESLEWRIRAEQIKLLDTELDVCLPMDSIFMASNVDLLHLQSGEVDLRTKEVLIGHGRIVASHLSYQTEEQPSVSECFDTSCLALSDLSLELRDLHSLGRDLSLSVQKGMARDRSGFALTHLQGVLRMDSLSMNLRNLALRTDHSAIYGELELPWSLFEREHKGQFYTILDGAIGAKDVNLLFGRNLLEVGEGELGEDWLGEASLTGPIDFALHTRGSVDSLWIDQCQFLWGGVLDLSARGSLISVDRPRQRRGSLSVEGGTQAGASTLLSLISSDLALQYSLPDGLTFKGQLGFGGGRDLLSMMLKEGDGSLVLKGSYNEQTEAYSLKVDAQRINLTRYIRRTNLGELSAEAELSGHGLDWRSKHTHSLAKVRLHSLAYADRQLMDITLDGTLGDGVMSLAINSFNEGLNLSAQIDGLLSSDGVYSSLFLETEELDLERWGLGDLPLKVRGQLSGELRTDYKQTHSLMATARDMHFFLAGRELRPKEVELMMQTSPTTSLVKLSSGDLHLNTQIAMGADALGLLSERLGILGAEVRKQVADTASMRLRLEHVFEDLPSASLSFAMGGDNALRPYLAEQGIFIEGLSAQFDLTDRGELRGHLMAQNIRQDTLRLGQVSLNVNTLKLPRTRASSSVLAHRQGGSLPSDSMVLDLTYALSRERYRTQEGYTIMGNVRASLQEARGQLSWIDMAGKPRHDITLEAFWDGTHYRLRLPDPNVLIAYQSFAVNEANVIKIHKHTYGIDSELTLKGGKGELLALKSMYDVSIQHQEGALQVQRISLEDFHTLGLRDLGGVVFADAHYGRTGGWDEHPSITGDLSVQRLRYEDKELGHFATALFYEPRTDRSHYISIEMSHRGNEALSIDAVYYPDHKDNTLRGVLAFKGLPLEVSNPFLHSYGINLSGLALGTLSLSGTLLSPRLGGYVRGESAQIQLEQYATTLELDSIPLRFERDALHFDHYALRSSRDKRNPLYIDGMINLSGPRSMTADLRLQARNMTLLDQPRLRSERELLYGRLMVSTDMVLRGRLDALKVRGRIDIQGGSNCIYVMREGGLAMSDRAHDLLSFIDFADTVFVREPMVESRLGGLDVNIALHIDPSVYFGVDLTADGTDYMRVQGGGDMQLSYPPYGEMKLLGRYDMSGGGQLHYTLPVVGGKLFEIAPTGYLRFNGNVYNPYINFRATQQVKATVGSASKKTSFVVGIEVKDHIEDINLGFDLSAPEDLSVQNTISTMTEEERGKQAIALMATGMFLAGGMGGKLKFDSALSSLLQSQINKAAGMLLRGTDINVGMETHDGSSGGVYRDYTYSFSRRFYNDRIRVVVGGKIQSGNVPSNQEQTLIDNVALEYQLDKAGDQHLRLYHKRITDNALEGEHTETGLGYLIKRKLSRPTDLFLFYRPRSREAELIESGPWEGIPRPLPTDTITSQIKK